MGLKVVAQSETISSDTLSAPAEVTLSSSNRERDTAVVQRVLAGDRSAYQELVHAYQDRLIALALQIVRSREEAEDIAQESFVKAYLSLGSFRQEASFSSWLYRIAYNMAIDSKRRSGKAELVTVDGEGNSVVEDLADDGRHDPGLALERKEEGTILSRALAELSDEHRAALVLREVDGLSYEEIAQVTAVSRGTVMSRLHNARRLIQERIKRLRLRSGQSKE